MPTRTSRLTAGLFEHFNSRKPLRTGSLIVTLFGDSIAPRGGVVWIGSLINTLASLGVSQRLVRTAMFRLVQDGILHNEQVGRRSYYALTEAGRQQFDAASLRIYTQPKAYWSGTWGLVLLSGVDVKRRHAVRQALGWLGFGQFGPETLAHPNPDLTRVRRQLANLDVATEAVLLEANLDREEDESGLKHLVSQTWDLPGLARAYAGYEAMFAPVLRALGGGAALSEKDAYFIRSFMIHEYRKVVLRDPALPRPMLPANWQGHSAYQLTRELYRQVLAPSEKYIDAHFLNQSGALPAPDQSFLDRFGGLRDDCGAPRD